MTVIQFTLRVDEEVLRQTKHRAVDAKMSQNEYIVSLMERDTGALSARQPASDATLDA